MRWDSGFEADAACLQPGIGFYLMTTFAGLMFAVLVLVLASLGLFGLELLM